MQASPTTLITPAVPDLSSSDLFGLPPMAFIVGGVVLICMYFAFAHRQHRKLDPRELAFRTLSRKLGLTKEQVSQLRKHAIKAGLTSPVGLVMCPELSAQIMRD